MHKCLVTIILFLMALTLSGCQSGPVASHAELIRRRLGSRPGYDVRLIDHGYVSVWSLDASARDVLKAYERTTGRRIVLDRDVKGLVTTYYEGTDFYLGLESILKPVGLTYQELDDTIFVYFDRLLVLHHDDVINRHSTINRLVANLRFRK